MAAILWALELANFKKFPCIIVERDSKICCDALISGDSDVTWNVSNILFNTLECRKSFSSCTFVWIRREANERAHALAKFASQSRTYFSCDMSSLPKPVLVSWRRDVLCSVVQFLNEVAILFTKKRYLKYR